MKTETIDALATVGSRTTGGGAWLIKSSRKVLGRLHIKTRVGFEVDNVFSGQHDPQAWFPIAGYDLRAPVTWSVMPGR